MSENLNFDPEYDILEVPGIDNLKIAVIPAMRQNDLNDENGTKYIEWTVTIGTLLLPKPFVELYGWYAESERSTGTDVGNKLFTSASIKHSELVIVIPSGAHLASIENHLANGHCISSVIITHLIRLGGSPVPIPTQVNTFGDCYVTGVQQYLDYLIVRMRISTKSVTCTAFSQEGKPAGVGTYNVSFVKNKNFGFVI